MYSSIDNADNTPQTKKDNKLSNGFKHLQQDTAIIYNNSKINIIIVYKWNVGGKQSKQY